MPHQSKLMMAYLAQFLQWD